MEEKVHRVQPSNNLCVCDWDLLRVTQYDLQKATVRVAGPTKERMKNTGPHCILMTLSATTMAALNGKLLMTDDDIHFMR